MKLTDFNSKYQRTTTRLVKRNFYYFLHEVHEEQKLIKIFFFVLQNKFIKKI